MLPPSSVVDRTEKLARDLLRWATAHLTQGEGPDEAMRLAAERLAVSDPKVLELARERLRREVEASQEE